MVAMPWIVKHSGLSDIVGGAWIGGTIDTSGAVVAAGALLSEAATKTSVIVKFSQNAFIGLAAFMLSVWWALNHGTQSDKRSTIRLIWDRFPKFVLGFSAASLSSFVRTRPSRCVSEGILTGLRTWFALFHEASV